MAQTFVSDFKRFFLRGLAAMLPPLLTLIIIIYILQFVDKNIGAYIDRGFQWLVVQAVAIGRGERLTFRGPDRIWTFVRQSFWQPWHLNWLSFLLSFVLIYVFGRFVASLLGRGLWRMIEQAFFRLPVMKQIYPSVKQVTDFLLAERKMAFSRVVAVEYPRKGIWSVGLLTNEGMRSIQAVTGEDLATVFIPSSPTPVTGYTITMRRDELIDLPISLDDALRFVVSAGVIMPGNQRLTEQEILRIRRGLFPLQHHMREEITS